MTPNLFFFILFLNEAYFWGTDNRTKIKINVDILTQVLHAFEKFLENESDFPSRFWFKKFNLKFETFKSFLFYC